MSCSLFKPTTPLRTKIGVVVTAVYLLGLTSLVYWRWCEITKMPLNGIADVAAGAFGPLAFLWLVIGYLQQGDELKQNTDALRLQAEELANTVQQQKELVALGHQQLEKEKQLAQEERNRQDIAARPRFEFTVLGLSYAVEGWNMLSIDIKNSGAPCSHFQTSMSTDGLSITKESNPKDSQKWRVIASGPQSVPFEYFDFKIFYIDASGNGGSQMVRVESSQGTYQREYVVIGEAEMNLANLDLRHPVQSL